MFKGEIAFIFSPPLLPFPSLRKKNKEGQGKKK
jgi:hypothetical protein